MPHDIIPPGGGDITWLSNMISAVGGALFAVSGWSFFAGRKTKDFESRLEAVEGMSSRIDELENGVSSRIDSLDKLIRSLEKTLAASALQRSEQTGEIRTSVAVTQALVAEMKKDIEAIFNRLERRQVDLYPPPHGERRDQ